MRLKLEDYLISKDNKKGKLVQEGFEYNSGNNDNFLNIKDIEKINQKVLNFKL